MSDISKVLVQLVWLDIFGKIKNPTKIDIKGWVANQGYFVEVNCKTKQYKLIASDSSYLMTALANDCNRMAMASIETICGVYPEIRLPRSGAWGLIRTYYAAFFAAHALLRMFGRSCSYLDSNHVNKINEIAGLFTTNKYFSPISPGFYGIEIDRAFNYVQIRPLKDSHKDTWREFISLLSIISDQCTNSANIAALSSHKLEAFDLITKIKNGIFSVRANSNAINLSELRNSVNYQQSHHLWFPYGGSSAAVEYIDNISNVSNLTLDACGISGGPGEVNNFFEVCKVIISLLLELIIACDNKVDGMNNIFSNGTLKLMNLVKS